MASRVMYFEIQGRIVPYVRMTQRSMWVNRRALVYRADQQRLRGMFISLMEQEQWTPFERRERLYLMLEVAPSDHRRDLSNELKAIEDAMQGVVYPDDRWIEALHAERIQDREPGVRIWISNDPALLS